MKKSLKLVPAATEDGPAEGEEFVAAEDVFVDAVIEEIRVLGRLRATMQADSASQLSRLQSVAEDGDRGELQGRLQVYQDLVNFHGETLLLLHWTILAYTAIVKLLKKHQRRTGTLLQAPHLRGLLAEESWSIEPPNALITTAAALISQLDHELYSSSSSAPSPASAIAARHSSHSPTSRKLDNATLITALDAVLAAAGNSNEDGAEDSNMDDARGGHGRGGDGGGDGGGGDGGIGAGGSGGDSRASSHIAASHQHQHRGGTRGRSGASSVGGVSGGQSSVGRDGTPEGGGDGDGGNWDVTNRPLLQRMRAALETWEQLRLTASTPSTVLGVAQQQQQQQQQQQPNPGAGADTGAGPPAQQ